MEQSTCSSCAYFKQHYALDKRKIYRVYCGHCTQIRAKTKRPDAKSCEQYIYKEPDEDAFVTKEYLSKELLAYITRLDLLPQIGDS